MFYQVVVPWCTLIAMQQIHPYCNYTYHRRNCFLDLEVERQDIACKRLEQVEGLSSNLGQLIQ